MLAPAIKDSMPLCLDLCSCLISTTPGPNVWTDMCQKSTVVDRDICEPCPTAAIFAQFPLQRKLMSIDRYLLVDRFCLFLAKPIQRDGRANNAYLTVRQLWAISITLLQYPAYFIWELRVLYVDHSFHLALLAAGSIHNGERYWCRSPPQSTYVIAYIELTVVWSLNSRRPLYLRDTVVKPIRPPHALQVRFGES